MKKILALVLALTLALGTFSFAAAAPSDVVGTDYEDAVGKLTYLGIIAGYPDGTFKPDQPVTRAEFAKIIVTALGVGEAAQYAAGATKFADVPADHWATGYINVAVDLGIINGYPDGTFVPENQVTFAEAIKMIVAALGYTPKAEAMGGYPGGYIAIAADEEITEDVTVVGALSANRGDIALMVNNALDVDMMVQTTWGQYPEYEPKDGETLLKKLGVDEVEGVVTAIPRVDSKLDDNEIRINAEDNDFDGTYEVVGAVNFELAFGQDVTAYVKDDEVIGITVESDYFYDALEDVADDELTLVGEDEDYDLAEDVVVWINGDEEDEDELADSATYDFAKVVLNDDGDVAFVDAYNWTDYVVVEEVDGVEVFGYGDEVDLDDFTVAKDGAAIAVEDIEEGDILFYNTGAEYAVVYVEAVEGEIEEIFSGKFEVAGKSFDFTNDSYGAKAVQYINEDGDIDNFDDEVAEQMEEEGAVVVFMDWAGNAVFISGELGAVEKSTFGAVLYENMDGYTDTRDRAYLELKVVNEEGEAVTYEFRLDDLEDVEVDGTEYEVEDIVPDPAMTGNSYADFDVQYENASGTLVWEEDIALPTQGEVVEITLDDSGDVVGLGLFTATNGFEQFVDADDYESGDSYIETKRMGSSVPVFIVDAPNANWGTWTDSDWDDEDVEVTTYGELDEDVDLKEGKIFHDGSKALYMVVVDSSITKTTDELAVLTQVRKNTDDEITRVKALVGGEVVTYYVEDPDDLGSHTFVAGDAVILEVIDANSNVKQITAATNTSTVTVNSSFDVITRDRELTDGTGTWELVDDGYIYDVTDTGDIEEMTFSDLKNVEDGSVLVVKESSSTKYAKFFLYTEGAGTGSTPTGITFAYDTASEEVTVDGLTYKAGEAEYILRVSGDALAVAVYSDTDSLTGASDEDVVLDLTDMIPVNGVYKLELINTADYDEVVAEKTMYLPKND